MTELQIIAIYCFCDDFLKSRGHKDWPNVKTSLAEVMLVYIVATKFFYGNIESAVDPKVWHELIKF